MDALTHVFLPLTVAYAVRPDFFRTPVAFALGGLGLLSDFDKFLGVPGALHSLVTLAPVCFGVLLADRLHDGRVTWGWILVAFIASHLLLDLLDGGPVPLLYPFVETGIGLTYPINIAFGTGVAGVGFDGAPAAIRVTAPRPGFNTYGFIQGTGVAWALAFATIVAGRYLDPTLTEEDSA